MNHGDTKAQRSPLNDQQATRIDPRRTKPLLSAPCLGASVVHPKKGYAGAANLVAPVKGPGKFQWGQVPTNNN